MCFISKYSCMYNSDILCEYCRTNCAFCENNPENKKIICPLIDRECEKDCCEFYENSCLVKKFLKRIE